MDVRNLTFNIGTVVAIVSSLLFLSYKFSALETQLKEVQTLKEDIKQLKGEMKVLASSVKIEMKELRVNFRSDLKELTTDWFANKEIIFTRGVVIEKNIEHNQEKLKNHERRLMRLERRRRSGALNNRKIEDTNKKLTKYGEVKKWQRKNQAL